MRRVRYDAPAGHRLLAYGYEITGGETVDMKNADAEQLAADPNVNVTVLDEAAIPELEPDAEGEEGAQPDEEEK